MEQWEALLDDLPPSPDVRYYTKIVQTARILVKHDLAPFESEWIVQTLLDKPINLLSMMSTKHSDDAWSKLLGDCFRLLYDLTMAWPDPCQQYADVIAKTCLLPYSAQTHNQALHCMTSPLICQSASTELPRLVNSLDTERTSRAPLATLIGIICEEHPEVVSSSDLNNIWRTFLNQLGQDRNTDKVTSSLLEAILCLFKHFGQDLPCMELNEFYDKLADLVKTDRCTEACLKILHNYASLFREKLSMDVNTRHCIWLRDKPMTSRVLLSIYTEICLILDTTALQNIVTTELQPRSKSSHYQTKYTALRIMSYIQTYRQIQCIDEGHTDVHTLEFEMKSGSIDDDTARAIHWVIESNHPGNDKLLQTAILFFNNLSPARRKEIVVYGILNAPPEIRTGAVTFLTTESIQDLTALEKYFTIWKELFDTKDCIVIERSRYVFEDYMSYVLTALDNIMEEENLPEKLSNLLHLTASILTIQPAEPYTEPLCSVLLQRCRGAKPYIAAGRAATGHVQDENILELFYKSVSIERCNNEALLCESCLALIDAPSGTVDDVPVLQALQITFSRNDVEPKILSKALAKFEHIVNKQIDEKNGDVIAEVMSSVYKLSARKDMNSKDARILHREVTMFIGKYGNKYDLNAINSDSVIVAKLKDSLTLNIPNPNDGAMYKVNLRSLLQLAIVYEDADALMKLVTIMIAHLSSKNEPVLRACLPRVILALCRAHARGDDVTPYSIQRAVACCDTVNTVHILLQYITSEKSPGVRKTLSAALESQLSDDSRHGTEVLTTAAADRAMHAMAARSTTKRAGLNITEILIEALKQNNSLAKNLLPDLLCLITNTFEIESNITFETASKIFMDKIEIFENETIEKLIKDLLATFMKGNNKMADSEFKMYKKLLSLNLGFIKNVFDYKKEGVRKFLDIYNDIEVEDFEKSLFFLSDMKIVFGLNTELCRAVLTYRECFVIKNLFCMEIETTNYFRMEAILKFLEMYEEVLLEIEYQKTLVLLSQIIENISPNDIIVLHKSLKSCLSVYLQRRTPRILLTGLEKFCQNLPIDDITTSIDKEYFTEEHASIVKSVKIMLNIFNLTDLSLLTLLSCNAVKWPKILLKLYSTGYIVKYLRPKMDYLTDLLTVSVKFMSKNGLKNIILEGSELEGVSNEKIGIKFCRFFMEVFLDIFVREPYIFLDEDMAPCCILLNDIVKHALKKKYSQDIIDNILELVNQLWPTYEIQTTLNEKHSLLSDMATLPKRLGPESNPLQWVVRTISDGGDGWRLIGVLPGGETFSTTYRTVAATLPTRLSEMTGSTKTTFRCLLDALAQTKDLELLDILTRLADGEESKGWWDQAIDDCMSYIANDVVVLRHAQDRCRSVAASRRVLVPLLRYSSSSVCEQFYCSVIGELLSCFKTAYRPSNHYKYYKYVADCTTALMLLQIACEKLPLTSLESPNSLLYQAKKPSQSWHLIRETCRLCRDLRTKIICPDDADFKLKILCRQYQRVNYSCLSAAICRRRPEEKFYNLLLGVENWSRLVDFEEQYSLRLRNQWYQRTKRTPVSIEQQTAGSVLTRTRTRTRLFLRTLSENAWLHDLLDNEDDDDEVIIQDIELSDNEINSQDVAATLTALLNHLSTLPFVGWVTELTGVLLGDGHRNLKWLLAQVICNCKEELKQQASALRPALLAVVVDTAENGRLLNQLHVDCLNAILHWDEQIEHTDKLNPCIELLLRTCVENRGRGVFKTLVDTLMGIVEKAGTVHVDWSLVEPYFNDPEDSKTLQLLLRLTKSKVHIPELLPALLTKLESKGKFQIEIARLFGSAMAVLPQRDPLIMVRWKKLLNSMRRENAGQFVRTVYYAQKECVQCCDDDIYRAIIDAKVIGPDRSKYLQIIATFISHFNSEYTQDMFDSIELSDLILAESVDALMIAKEGLSMMSEGVRRRVVKLAGGMCGHPDGKIRMAAGNVVVRGFEDLFKSPEVQSAKKPRLTTTPILNSMFSNDLFVNTIMSCIGIVLTDLNDDISKQARDVVAKYLSEDMGVRFKECVYLTLYLPSVNNKNVSMSVCVSAFLDMYFSVLRSQDRFMKILLRDEPLEIRSTPSGPSKLLTMSRTFQGTFRTHSALTDRRKKSSIAPSDTTAPDIDVQIPINTILSTFMRFAADVQEASQALLVQISRTLKGCIDSDMALLLKSTLVNNINQLTPLIIELCIVFIEDCSKISGFDQNIQTLLQSTKSSEGEPLVQMLYQDILSRCSEDMVLGGYDDDDDVMMEILPFCLDDLTSSFGKLSNWDDLTLRQRRDVYTGLPELWTDCDHFKDALRDYSGSEDWFSKSVSAYRHEDKQYTVKWLRELDKWPRRPFAVSAVTEAIQWQSLLQVEAQQFPCDIQPSDCLAEWAARLMIRSAFHTSLQTDSNNDSESMLSCSHALKWSIRANEMALPHLALNCVKSNVLNVAELDVSETLSWLHERLYARRTIALLKNDEDMLGKTLSDAESFISQYTDTTSESKIKMRRLILQLHTDLNILTSDKIQDILQDIDKRCLKSASLAKIFEIMLNFYKNIWEDRDLDEHNDLVKNISEILDKVSDAPERDMLVDMIVNILENYYGILPEDLARYLLNKLQPLPLDEFTLSHLKTLSIFPSHLLTEYTFMNERDSNSMKKCKQYLELVCDAPHALFSYCQELYGLAGVDEEKWIEVFKRMKSKIFENPFRGTDYQLLDRYKSRLYEIEEFDYAPTFKSKSQLILKEVIKQLIRPDLGTPEPKATLRLSQLSPMLVSERDICLNTLLGLDRKIQIIRFDEQLRVFKNSVRRPVLLRLLLSTGAHAQYIVKSGEYRAADAGAQRLARAANILWDYSHTSYMVTPLSEDCGLIEFLEDHEVLRAMVQQECNITNITDKITPKEPEELLEDPITSLVQSFRQRRELIPKYALRSAVQLGCTNVQELIEKSRSFENSAAAMAVLGWVLGLGDRHLENILYSNSDGRITCIDWAAVFQWNEHTGPPARLTANVITMCRDKVLESHIQKYLNILRDKRNIILPYIRTCFKWMATDFEDKFSYIKSILEGSALSYEVTRDFVNQTDSRNKTKYIQILDDVFKDYVKKDIYSIEEQVSCLLLHCTDPRILCVTRTNWEPWV